MPLWHSEETDAGPAPTTSDEYRLYQVLVAVWPDGHEEDDSAAAGLADRVARHMLKAAREAQQRTAGCGPNRPMSVQWMRSLAAS
jgi:(1->4)-alpha-D-glucan 1-alpha-D-glucosylmutase